MTDRAAGAACCLRPPRHARARDWSVCRQPFRATSIRTASSGHVMLTRWRVRAARLAGAGCAARPIAPARSPTAVSVRSVEAGGPRFLDCLPTIVDRIVAVGGIVAAVRRAGVVAAVVRAAIIAICTACDRATD
jgi:hypothetical protein